MTDGLKKKKVSQFLLLSLLYGSSYTHPWLFRGVFITAGPSMFIALNGFQIVFFGSSSFAASSPSTD